MSRRETVGDIRRTSDSGSGDEYGPEFIRSVDERQPKIHEVWTFGEEGVTPKAHPTVRVDIGAFVGECFATDYLTPTWCRIPMFGRNYINRIVVWIFVPNFLSNYGPPWTLNLLAPYSNWGDRGPSSSLNLGSGYGGYSEGICINWNRPSRVLPIYHRRIFENTCSAARRARDNLLMENRMYHMQSPSTCHNPICSHLVNRQDDALDDRCDFSVRQ